MMLLKDGNGIKHSVLNLIGNRIPDSHEMFVIHISDNKCETGICHFLFGNGII